MKDPIATAAATRRENSVWSDIPRRLSTICLGIPLLWIFWLDDTRRWVFFQATHAFMAYEWSIIINHTFKGSVTRQSATETDRFRLLPTQVSLSIASVLLANISDPFLFHVCAVAAIAAATVLAADRKLIPESLHGVLMGYFLITIPMRAWTDVSHGFGFCHVVDLLLTVWNCDTGALLAGRMWRTLCHTCWTPTWLARISPAKSVQGLVGGLMLGTLTYCGMPLFWRHAMEWTLLPVSTFSLHTSFADYTLTRGIILSLAALVGDLWESSLKRHYGVKDTGQLLPGHGGVLDRFDSSLIAVLVYAVMVRRD